MLPTISPKDKYTTDGVEEIQVVDEDGRENVYYHVIILYFNVNSITRCKSVGFPPQNEDRYFLHRKDQIS